MKSLNIRCAIAFIAIASTSFAKEQHGAHEHGKAELNVAIDGGKVVLAFESPADSIYGFEHEAKSAKDIAARDNAVKLLKDDAANLFQFSGDVGCKLTDTKIEPWVKEGEDKDDYDHDHDAKTPAKAEKGKPTKGKKAKHHHGEHGEVHATYTFTCTKAPTGSKLTVNLTDKFAKLRQITVQLISDQKQSGATIKAGNKTLDL